MSRFWARAASIAFFSTLLGCTGSTEPLGNQRRFQSKSLARESSAGVQLRGGPFQRMVRSDGLLPRSGVGRTGPRGKRSVGEAAHGLHDHDRRHLGRASRRSREERAIELGALPEPRRAGRSGLGRVGRRWWGALLRPELRQEPVGGAADCLSACCRCGRGSTDRVAATRTGRAARDRPECDASARRTSCRTRTPRHRSGRRPIAPFRPR